MNNQSLKIKPPSVCILLSTYNGKNYIIEQLNSLANQRGVNIFIFARDDMSTDETPDILKSLCRQYSIDYKILPSKENIGPARSFFELLKNAPKNFDYYAFCDQDDYWLSSKLERAIRKISSHNHLPTLYSSSLAVCEADLSISRVKQLPEKPSLPQALIENNVTGCSLVINKIGYRTIINMLPTYCIMHDWWIYLCFSAVGHIVFDNSSSILYRQHTSNHFGMPNVTKVSLHERWKRHFNRKTEQSQTRQAAELLKFQDQISEVNLKKIKYFAGSKISLINRLRLIFDIQFKRNTVKNTFTWRILVILNRH